MTMSRNAATSARTGAADAGAKQASSGVPATRGSLLRRALRWGLRIVIVLVLLPVVLVPVYLVVPPVSTLMVSTRITDGPIRRDWVPFDAIAKVAVISVMVSEDARFCAHGGVDWTELNTVLENPSGPSRGASTITMQVARNLFLWQSPSYFRKALEFPLAFYADPVWGKRRTMEIYLNIAEWGPNVFGIEAAAQHHFGRSAKDLTANQAALLAVTLPSPRTRNPAKPSRAMTNLARKVAANAKRAGAYIECLYP